MRSIMALLCRIRFNPFEYSGDGGLGDIPLNSDGDLKLLNANRNDDGSWLNTNYDNPDNRWNRENGFAFVVSQLSLFLLYFSIGEFCFVSCPFQPPSIRPISLILSDRDKYLLLSKDLVSQRMSRKSLIVSFFRIAILR